MHRNTIWACFGVQLMKGFSAETSGGLLVCLPAEKADAFCEAVHAADGWRPYVVGRVVPGNRQARIVANAEVIAV
jgi:selenide,water dikinase